jgi:hypothetical protein
MAATIGDYLTLEFGRREDGISPDVTVVCGSYKAAVWNEEDGISYMQVTHYNKDHCITLSELTVATVVTDDVTRIFKMIFESNCAIEVHSLPEKRSELHAAGRAITVIPTNDESVKVVSAFYKLHWSFDDDDHYFYKQGITN